MDSLLRKQRRCLRALRTQAGLLFSRLFYAEQWRTYSRSASSSSLRQQCVNQTGYTVWGDRFIRYGHALIMQQKLL